MRNPASPWRRGPLACVLVLAPSKEVLVLDARSARIWDRAATGMGREDLDPLLGPDPIEDGYPTAETLFDDMIARSLLVLAE